MAQFDKRANLLMKKFNQKTSADPSMLLIDNIVGATPNNLEMVTGQNLKDSSKKLLGTSERKVQGPVGHERSQMSSNHRSAASQKVTNIYMKNMTSRHKQSFYKPRTTGFQSTTRSRAPPSMAASEA